MENINYIVYPGINHLLKEINCEMIIKSVCDFLCRNIEDVQKNIKKREVVELRQICHFFAVELLQRKKIETFENIGKKIGDRNYCTVLHSHNVCCDLFEFDSKFRSKLSAINLKLTGTALTSITRIERKWLKIARE